MDLILCGCNGRMGRVITTLANEQPDVHIVAGVDVNCDQNSSYPVYKNINDYTGSADCIIDFSGVSTLDSILSFCRQHHTPAVLATTGYSDEQLAAISDVAKEVPVFRSANMSLGINVLLELVKTATRILGDAYDIEIIEQHHNQKLDAPSGTALMIADAAASARTCESEYVYDRHAVRQKRAKSEIGISSVRGGTIVGIHDVLFAGHDEQLEIRHTATSREVFAVGALRAASFLASKTEPGLYNMSDFVKELV